MKTQKLLVIAASVCLLAVFVCGSAYANPTIQFSEICRWTVRYQFSKIRITQYIFSWSETLCGHTIFSHSTFDGYSPPWGLDVRCSMFIFFSKPPNLPIFFSHLPQSTIRNPKSKDSTFSTAYLFSPFRIPTSSFSIALSLSLTFSFELSALFPNYPFRFSSSQALFIFSFRMPHSQFHLPIFPIPSGACRLLLPLRLPARR